MRSKYVIELDANDLGQVLDGLGVREEAWRNTAIFMRTGQMPKQSLVSEECRNGEEATRIAEHYKRIGSIIAVASLV